MIRYTPPNCSRCGRFVGKDGFHDYNPETQEVGYPLCASCLQERRPTINDLETEKDELDRLSSLIGAGDFIRKRTTEIENQIEDIKKQFRDRDAGA